MRLANLFRLNRDEADKYLKENPNAQQIPLGAMNERRLAAEQQSTFSQQPQSKQNPQMQGYIQQIQQQIQQLQKQLQQFQQGY